jgi:tetratricopeptide (TPR) repeat protein
MSSIFGLFDLFSLIYLFRTFQLTGVIWREKDSIKRPLLTRRKKWLADQASFFIAVPISVFIHELGHAIATWMFGGQVTAFVYRAFWGRVDSFGLFEPGEIWFISLAGTLGSLLFGVAVWLLFQDSRNGSFRYFGLRTLRFQVFYALIFYPAFTLFGFEGDWRNIYDFGATPIASAATALFHASLLFSFWLADRNGAFEMVSHRTAAEQETFADLERHLAAFPNDSRLQLQHIDALRRGGATRKAKSRLHRFVEKHPENAAGYLQLAVLKSGDRSEVSKQAVRHAEKALALGLPTPSGAATAHQIIGKYHLDGGNGDKAADHLSQAIAVLPEKAAQGQYGAQLYHWRSQAYRRQKQYDLAYQDLQSAIALARSGDDERLATFYESELAVLDHHAGRSMRTPMV